MEQTIQTDLPDDSFFGVDSSSENSISALSEESAEKDKQTYFSIISEFQTLCRELKLNGEADGNSVRTAIDLIVESLRQDERMLLSLANAPYIYISRHLDDAIYTPVVVHGVNVMIYSLKISIDLGVPDIRLPYIAAAALFHRLGLLTLSEEQLRSPVDHLTTFGEIDNHPQDPIEYINNITIDDFHMESIHYLINLIQENQQILRNTSLREAMYQYSMVIHLCYRFEILTHQSPDGDVLAPVDAMKNMRDNMKGYFHPDIIKLFFNKLSIYPLGSFVKLSSGETAKVVAVNERFIIRPVIMIVLDSEDREKNIPVRINLRETPNLYIKRAIVNDYLTEKYINLF